jgi:hypothetical protein
MNSRTRGSMIRTRYRRRKNSLIMPVSLSPLARLSLRACPGILGTFAVSLRLICRLECKVIVGQVLCSIAHLPLACQERLAERFESRPSDPGRDSGNQSTSLVGRRSRPSSRPFSSSRRPDLCPDGWSAAVLRFRGACATILLTLVQR